jgi:hypothetical protein
VERYRLIWNIQSNEFTVPDLQARPLGDRSAAFKDFQDLDAARLEQEKLKSLASRYESLYGSSKFRVVQSPAIIDRMGE